MRLSLYHSGVNFLSHLNRKATDVFRCLQLCQPELYCTVVFFFFFFFFLFLFLLLLLLLLLLFGGEIIKLISYHKNSGRTSGKVGQCETPLGIPTYDRNYFKQ